MKKITNDIYLIQMPQLNSRAPQVNVYLIKSEKILIDAGPDNYQCFLKLSDILKKFAIDIHELKVIITHHHPDHVGLLKYFPHDIQVYSTPSNQYYGTNAYVTALNSQLKQLEHLNLPAEVIDNIRQHMEKRYLPYLSEFNFHTPEELTNEHFKFMHFCGHTADDLVIQKDQIFFGGDLILKGIYFNSLFEIDPNNNQLVLLKKEYNNTVDQILNDRSIDHWLPGHGEPMNKEQLLQVHHQEQRLTKLIHSKIDKYFSFQNYQESIKQIYGLFPQLNDYFYLSDILAAKFIES